MQVDPTFKSPGTKSLKLKYDEPLQNFSFKCNLRRYTEAFLLDIPALLRNCPHAIAPTLVCWCSLSL